MNIVLMILVLSGIAANNRTNVGEGGKYVDFLVKTLKPFIDKKYRTLKDQKILLRRAVRWADLFRCMQY